MSDFLKLEQEAFYVCEVWSLGKEMSIFASGVLAKGVNE
jgi:hypothetical protein